ncbi:MAG: ATPase, T2SS/T4P/T4SS family [Fimbriimonas sp.]|nr:ATPase, T2SS/T4P/T4SS family [Fimbriimonas sp.]
MMTRKEQRVSLGRLGERLIRDGLLAEEQLRQALERQQQFGGSLGDILVSMGFLASSDIKPYLEQGTGFPFVDISEEEIDRDLVAAVPKDTVLSRMALPFREVSGRILVAMADPLDIATIDEYRAIFNKPIEPCLALGADLNESIRRSYDAREKVRNLIHEIGFTNEAENEPIDDLIDQSNEAPIVKLVNSLVGGAIAAGASDIHLEPQEGNVRVRYRIDGVMYEQMTLPNNHLAACVSRLKIMSGLDIAERRRPQDGRFSTRDDSGREYDIRMSLMPTVYGEKACMRLLEKANSMASLERIGFFPEQRAMFQRFIRRPHGLILVTGPTGSGKSTTLYAGLQAINDATKNINTIEDPVEYRLPGINQMQVNQKIGVTFAAGLRTLVRQDPDVILVGEIRDKDTAETAIQAALTGHLVLSTLHTNDAPGAVVRLQNMGVEPFLISSAIVGVVGQRLVRNLCPYCRQEYQLSMAMALTAGIPMVEGKPPTVARPVGCKRCGGRGMKGRSAVMEILPITDKIRDMVLQGCTGQEITIQAISEGMKTMKECAILRALELQISIEEILRVFAQEE